MNNPLRMAGAICAAGAIAGCASDTKIAQPTVVPVMTVKHSFESADGYYALGRYHHGGERHAEARRAYESALRLDPGHERAANALAVLHAQSGDLDTARSMLATLIEKRPKTAHLHSNIGYVHLLAGEYDAARRAFETALALDPGERRARANLAVVLERTGGRESPDTKPQEPARAGKPESGGTVAITQLAPHVYTLAAANASPSQVKAAPVPAAGRPSRPRIEVSNGNGVHGMAKALAGMIGSSNGIVTRLTNQKPFNVAATHVRFGKGFEPEARRLAAHIGAGVGPASDPASSDADIRIVLGRDITDIDALRAHYREQTKTAGAAAGNPG